jgi:hypothetical protein
MQLQQQQLNEQKRAELQVKDGGKTEHNMLLKGPMIPVFL